MSQFSSSVNAVVSSASANLDSATHAKAIQLASLTLETCALAGVGNPTVAIAATHIVTTLLFHAMRWDPTDPRDRAGDRLVLSDATFAPLVYAACADLGVPARIAGNWRPLTLSDLATFGAADGPLATTPSSDTVALVEHTGGSRGLGLSQAVGNAMAARLEGVDRRVFCLISDAELREGQHFEALAHIIEERLVGVLPVFVVGALAANDRAAPVDMPESIGRRLTAMGFHAIVVDGHTPAQIRDAVEQSVAKAKSNQPSAIIARCTKGWGAKSIQGGAWTGRVPTGEKLKSALEELRSARVGLTRSFGTELAKPAARAKSAVSPMLPLQDALDTVPDFARAMREADMLAVYQGGRLSTRRAHALALRAIGRAHEGISLFECDTRANNISELFAADRALAPRFVEFRSATSHMVSTASAMSAMGRVVFAGASARAFGRAHEPIEVAARSGTGVVLTATSAGLGAIADGIGATSTSDVTWFRSLCAQRNASGSPLAYLLQPADAFAAYALTLAATEHADLGQGGLSMLRLPAGDQEFLYNAETVFNLGKFEVLVEGRDLLIVTAGAMVHEVNRALDGLDDAGIDATVVDLYSIPFDEVALLDLANKNGGRILVVEDNVGGAIAGAVSEACTAGGDAFTIESMCVRALPMSAKSFDEALRLTGLSAAHIVACASRMLGVETGSERG